MSRFRLPIVVVMLASLLAASGCATGSGFSFPLPSFLAKKDDAAGTGTVDKAAKARIEQQQRAMQGLPPEEPGVLSKMGKNISDGFTSATNKVTSLFTGKKSDEDALDPVSLKMPANPSADTFVGYAQLQERSGRTADALDQYKKALEIDPNHLGALLGTAHLLDRQNKLDEAAEKYSRAITKHPKNARAWNDFALCAARRGRMEESAQALRRAIELQPDRALYRNNLAKVLIEQGKTAEALTQLESIQGKAIAHYNVGYLLQERGDMQGAIQQFQLACSVDPNMQPAREWLAKLAPGPQAGPQTQLAVQPQLPQATVASRPQPPAPHQPNMLQQPTALQQPTTLAPRSAQQPAPPAGPAAPLPQPTFRGASWPAQQPINQQPTTLQIQQPNPQR